MPERQSRLLAAHTEVFINGAQAARHELDMLFGGSLFFVYDDRKFVGSYGAWFEYCLDTRGYAIGAYTAEIRITSMSGRMYSYTWRFRITRG